MNRQTLVLTVCILCTLPGVAPGSQFTSLLAPSCHEPCLCARRLVLITYKSPALPAEAVLSRAMIRGRGKVFRVRLPEHEQATCLTTWTPKSAMWHAEDYLGGL